MTRISVQQGSVGSSSNRTDEELEEVQELVVMDDLLEYSGSGAENKEKIDDLLPENLLSDRNDDDIVESEKTKKLNNVDSGDLVKHVGGFTGLRNRMIRRCQLKV
ncbi:hypothetical protein F0562_022454 [Nyssa sinensis]|uniref:Uncharacterized protein n=1 Tax=Nyssa sinensis TaxID=561372 RepID=A0A5J5BP95_9ASTE|nr:hypothetical protein F0562_022454 [Nyssa sinensis]